MEVKFYLKDIQEEVDQKGTLRTVKDVLFFSLLLPKRNGADTPATDFDNKATEEHVKLYRDAYKEFKMLNPSYVLPWPELDVVVEPVKVAPLKVTGKQEQESKENKSKKELEE